MTDNSQSLSEINDRIAAVQENLRALIEQAAAFSGAADDELAAQRIDDQQAELDRLLQLREELEKG